MPMESLVLLGLCSAPRAKVSSLPLTQSPCLSLSLCISDSFLYPLGSLEPLLTSHLSRSAPPHQPPWYSRSTPDIVTLQGLCICSALHPSRTPRPQFSPCLSPSPSSGLSSCVASTRRRQLPSPPPFLSIMGRSLFFLNFSVHAYFCFQLSC